MVIIPADCPTVNYTNYVHTMALGGLPAGGVDVDENRQSSAIELRGNRFDVVLILRSWNKTSESIKRCSDGPRIVSSLMNKTFKEPKQEQFNRCAKPTCSNSTAPT